MVGAHESDAVAGFSLRMNTSSNEGLFWELNPGPLAPKARIMPLDQTANNIICVRSVPLDASLHSLRPMRPSDTRKMRCSVALVLLQLCRSERQVLTSRSGVQASTEAVTSLCLLGCPPRRLTYTVIHTHAQIDAQSACGREYRIATHLIIHDEFIPPLGLEPRSLG